MERIKDIYFMQPIFLYQDFDSSGGIWVMKLTASGHPSLLIEVRGKFKYMH